MYLPMALAGLLLLALACSDEGGAARGDTAAAPDPQATITALQQSRSTYRTPTPTAVPESARDAAQAFAQGLQAAGQRWDRVHSDYDTWQAGLAACNPTSVRASLGQFAGQIGEISQSARDLPRASATRGFADRVVQAAGIEAQALRALRDGWQPGGTPATAAANGDSSQAASEDSGEEDTNGGSGASGNPGPVSGFAQVDTARSDAADMIHAVSDDLTDLDEAATPEGLALLEDFTLAFQAANLRWDTFHQDYDAFRVEEAVLTSSQVVERLGELVTQFSQVALAARELPKLASARDVARLMADTADAEDLALRRIRATFQKEGGADDSGTANGEDGGSGDGDSNGGDFVAMDPTLFEGFEVLLVASNTSRREALEAMADLNLSLSEEQLGKVDGFNQEYQALLSDWNDFHSAYDAWRLTDGGCDRDAAIKVLAELGAQFNQLSADVGDLPNTTVLRPLGELLVEAVHREASALTDLRDSWRPFDADIYQAFRQERVGAERLRRQVAVGVQDLLDRYGLDQG